MGETSVLSIQDNTSIEKHVLIRHFDCSLSTSEFPTGLAMLLLASKPEVWCFSDLDRNNPFLTWTLWISPKALNEIYCQLSKPHILGAGNGNWGVHASSILEPNTTTVSTQRPETWMWHPWSSWAFPQQKRPWESGWLFQSGVLTIREPLASMMKNPWQDVASLGSQLVLRLIPPQKIRWRRLTDIFVHMPSLRSLAVATYSIPTCHSVVGRSVCLELGIIELVIFTSFGDFATRCWEWIVWGWTGYRGLTSWSEIHLVSLEGLRRVAEASWACFTTDPSRDAEISPLLVQERNAIRSLIARRIGISGKKQQMLAWKIRHWKVQSTFTQTCYVLRWVCRAHTHTPTCPKTKYK